MRFFVVCQSFDSFDDLIDLIGAEPRFDESGDPVKEWSYIFLIKVH
ncbi:MAG: hypothetical protein AAF514_07080 [Verrucomicrobiota bacterium]